jgi:hypothetical protein
MILRQNRVKRKGQGLVEYALLIAGVALVCAAAVAIFGHKTNDMISATAVVLPGAHAEDNAPIVSGKIIETGPADGADPANGIGLDVATILTNSDGTQERLGNNLGTSAPISSLVVEP